MAFLPPQRPIAPSPQAWMPPPNRLPMMPPQRPMGQMPPQGMPQQPPMGQMPQQMPMGQMPPQMPQQMPQRFAVGGSVPPTSAQTPLGGTQIASAAPYAQGGAHHGATPQLEEVVLQNPKINALVAGIRQQIGDMPAESIKRLEDMIGFALKHPDKYAHIREAAIKDHMVDPEDLPPQFNPQFLSLMLVVLVGLRKHAQTGVPQQGFATGGLAKAGQALQNKGRYGDTILAHINPQEAAMLRANGGSGTINPATGLPEYSWLSKQFKSIGHALGIHNWNDVRDIAESAAVLVGNYFLPGSSLLTSHLVSKGSQDQLNSGWGQALQIATGLGGQTGNWGKLADWGKGALGIQGANAAGTAANAATTAANAAQTGVNAAEAVNTAALPSTLTGIGEGASTGANVAASGIAGANAVALPTAMTAAQPTLAQQAINAVKGLGTNIATNTGKLVGAAIDNPLAAMTVGSMVLGGGQQPPPPDILQGISSLSPSQQEYFKRPSVQWDWDKIRADASASGMSVSDFMNRNWGSISGGSYNKQTTDYPSDQAQKKARGGQAYATGGALSKMAYLAQGSGSGRADTIDAKLSDGEFVVDAETVALLGDGSTKEGARRLNMMREQLRQQKGAALSKGKFSPAAKSPLAYMAGAR